MAVSQNDTPRSQPVPTDAQEREKIYENEINLMDYFRVLWKRKSLILLGSVLPAFIVGLILFFSSRNYKVTYVYDVKDQSAYDVKDRSVYDMRDQSGYDMRGQSGYDMRGQSGYDMRGQSGYDMRNRSYDVSNWNLDEKNYNVLLDRFYSEENLNKITNKLRENGLNRYAKLISRGGGYPKKFVHFDVWPPYTDISRAKITETAQLEHIRQPNAQLLNMTIVARPKNDIPIIASVIRDNLESVIPVSVVEEHLNADIRAFKAQIAGIEENRFNLELTLKTNKSILAKLKNIQTPVSDRSASNIALQFDISGKTEYLPVQYQIQATESKTVQLEAHIVANEDNRNYYRDLLALNEKLLAELKGEIASYYTIQQFHSFLTELVDSYKDKELKSYLSSYIKKIENRISASAPVTGKPSVSAVAKGTAKKSGIVLAISLMISVFAAFLLEGIQKSQAQAS